MRERLLGFVGALRRVGVPVSVGETLDAMEAVAAAGIERHPLREALAATLVKDHARRPLFDAAFEAWFGAAGIERRAGAGGGTGGGAAGSRSGPAGGGAGGGARTPREEPDEERDEEPPERRTAAGAPASSRGRAGQPPRREREPPRTERGGAAVPGREAAPSRPRDAPGAADERRRAEQDRAAAREAEADAALRAAAQLMRRQQLAVTPFRALEPDEVGELRVLAADLARRFERRWSRRLRRARRGRVDVRRTLRRALATGGVPIELLRRARAPGRPDLIALVDVSWSTQVAAETLLALLAPSSRFFRGVRLFAYVADLAEISFEHGRIVPHEPLDVGARSDFGRVLGQLAERHGALSRDAVLLVLGDARNNRLPHRAAELRRIRREVRAVVWVNPEPRDRWDTGDSAMAAYAPHADLVLEAPDLASLEAALARLAVPRGGPARGARPARRGLA